MQNIIAPSKALGYSKLYLDFLAEKPSARKFFLSAGFATTASEIDCRRYPRSEMLEILRRQNKEYGSSPQALAAIEKLADPKAVCVLAGQQAGLFTHCMLVQLKAIAVAKKAAQLEKELSRPVVPVFWIAGDDHDLAEVSQAGVVNLAGAFEVLTYQGKQGPELPVGMISFSNRDALSAVIAQLRAALGESGFTSDLYKIIESSYTPDDTFVTAFAKMMAVLTASYDTVYFSPTDPAVSRLASPFFQRLIAENGQVREKVHTTNEAIQAEGYNLQVEKSDTATYMFHTGELGRTPITVEDGSFRVGGAMMTADQLTDLAKTSPERLTPDVLLRPVMQSHLFPVVAQFGGPSEIAYLAQLNPLFGYFGVPTPVHLPRPTATLVEKKQEKVMADLGINIEDLFGDVESVINRVMERSFPTDLEGKFAASRAEIAASFEKMIKASVAFDPGLEDFAKQSAGKADFAARTLEEKVFAAHKRKSKETREKIYRLEAALHPLRGPQDRSLNIGYFIAKYGFGVVSFLYDRVDVNQAGHQLLYLSEMKD